MASRSKPSNGKGSPASTRSVILIHWTDDSSVPDISNSTSLLFGILPVSEKSPKEIYDAVVQSGPCATAILAVPGKSSSTVYIRISAPVLSTALLFTNLKTITVLFDIWIKLIVGGTSGAPVTKACATARSLERSFALQQCPNVPIPLTPVAPLTSPMLTTWSRNTSPGSGGVKNSAAVKA